MVKPETQGLRKASVAVRLACSPNHIDRMVSQGRFPAPRKAGRISYWLEDEVDTWLRGQPVKRVAVAPSKDPE